MSNAEETALSIWPQSGAGVLSQLQLSLLTDHDDDDDVAAEIINECPPGLYWCKDSCYSHNICLMTRNQEGDNHPRVPGVDFNVLSSMLEPQLLQQVQIFMSNITVLHFTFQGDLRIRLNGPQTINIGEEIPVELVVENQDNQVRDTTIKILSNEKYTLPASRPSYKLTLQAHQRRSFHMSVKPIVRGDVRIIVMVDDIVHHLDVYVHVPGYSQSQHTSLMLDHSHHNRYSKHYIRVSNRTNNRVRLTVSGDTLGPLLFDEIPPSVSYRLFVDYNEFN